MFDLNKNAFFMLGVTPDTNEHDIVEAFEDVVSEHPEKEHELQSAQNNLRMPNKRLLEELTYLWGVSPEHWLGLFSSTPESWDGLTEVAKMNLAAHYCCLAPYHIEALMEKTLDALVRGRDAYAVLFDEIKTSRKQAQLPLPQEAQYQESLEAVAAMHRKAAMFAVENGRHGGKIMTKIVEIWRLHDSDSGRFVMDLCRDYDRWSISKLRPIEKKINHIIVIVRNETEKMDLPYGHYSESFLQAELNELEKLLSEWDEYSQPVQLIKQAKWLDEPKSKEIYNKLRSLAIELHNKFGMTKQPLRISQSLLNTFPELPGIVGLLADDVNALKKREEDTRA